MKDKRGPKKIKEKSKGIRISLQKEEKNTKKG